jgi:hypothetical protein
MTNIIYDDNNIQSKMSEPQQESFLEKHILLCVMLGITILNLIIISINMFIFQSSLYNSIGVSIMIDMCGILIIWVVGLFINC